MGVSTEAPNSLPASLWTQAIPTHPRTGQREKARQLQL